MDQTIYLSYRCPACGGRARVASIHAGQVILCPHCQAQGVAQPDVQPQVRPTPDDRRVQDPQPGSTTRFARPLDPATSSSSRRLAHQTAAPITASHHRQPAPRRDGFSTGELSMVPSAVGAPRTGATTISSGPATVTRRHLTPAQLPATSDQTGTGSMTPIVAASTWSAVLQWTALGAAAICVGIAVWACTEANGQSRVARDTRSERDQLTEAVATLKIQVESRERHLAQVQVELAAERANAAREREIAGEMQRTVNKLGEELARIARTGGGASISMVPTAAAIQAVTATGTFPAPGIPTAGVPSARKEKTLTTR